MMPLPLHPPSSAYPGLVLQADIGLAGRLVEKGEAKLREYQHPDPYIVPYYPGRQTGECQQGHLGFNFSTPDLPCGTCSTERLIGTVVMRRRLAVCTQSPFPKGAQAALRLGAREWTLRNPGKG